MIDNSLLSLKKLCLFLENHRKWSTFLKPLCSFRKPRSVSNIKIKNRVPGTQCLSQSFADKLLGNIDKPITVIGSPMDVRKAARNFQEQNDVITQYLHRKKNGASSPSLISPKNKEVNGARSDVSRSVTDDSISGKEAVIEIGDGDSQEQGTSTSPHLVSNPVLSGDQINIELLDNSKENPIAISDDSSDEEVNITKMPTGKRKPDDTSVSEIPGPSNQKRAMTDQSLYEDKTFVEDEMQSFERSILCGNANTKAVKNLSFTESKSKEVTVDIMEDEGEKEKSNQRTLSEESESNEPDRGKSDDVQDVEPADIETKNGNGIIPCHTVNKEETQKFVDKNLKRSSLYGNVNYSMVVNDVSSKESTRSEVPTDINKTPPREKSNAPSQINAWKSLLRDHSPSCSKAELPSSSVSLFDTDRNSEILKKTEEETQSDEELPGITMSAILNVQQMSGLKKEYTIERPRARNECSPNKKDDIDKPCSQWKIELFARYFDFENCVEELNVEISEDHAKFSADLDHMVSEFKRRVGIASSADKHHKRSEEGTPNFASLCRTEMGTRLILNEILFPLCSFLDFSVEIERNVDCLYLPNCRFDYRIFDKDGEIVGAVETKSAGSLRPDAVAQAVIELCILQTERLTKTKDSAKLNTPLFNVLTDGVRFVFIVLKGNKLHFEQAFNRIYVRELSDWDDVIKLYISLMQLMRSEKSMCVSKEKIDCDL